MPQLQNLQSSDASRSTVIKTLDRTLSRDRKHDEREEDLMLKELGKRGNPIAQSLWEQSSTYLKSEWMLSWAQSSTYHKSECVLRKDVGTYCPKEIIPCTRTSDPTKTFSNTLNS